jgi:hypothetical protein
MLDNNKIGFVVHFYDFRNDVRKIIDEVKLNNEVVLFCSKENEQNIRFHLTNGIELRIINERKKTNLNLFWERFYLIFKVIPTKSKENFFWTEEYKITNSKNNKLKGLFILKLIKFLPKFFSYDSYLNCLSYSSKTKIDDIDRFCFFSEISDDYFYSRLINLKKNVLTYVYSWDHSCKHTRFSKRAITLVWNNEIKNDLIELHQLKDDKIKIWGSTQLAFIEQYLKTKENYIKRQYNFKYIYFGCSVGISKLVKYEVEFINLISQMLIEINSDFKLVVRPYPVLQNWGAYDALKNKSNVILDNDFRSEDLSIKDSFLYEKFKKIEQAEALFHLGSTIGLEACFFNTPSFLIDLNKDKNNAERIIHKYSNQYQNKKYLVDYSKHNTITSTSMLKEVLMNLGNNDNHLHLNSKIKSTFPLKSFDQLAKELRTYNNS